MTYSFHPEAEEEFNKAIDYYEEQQAELGLDFSVEVYKTIQRIAANPKSWTSLSKSVRRALVYRFPFGLLYSHDADSEHIYIIAVMHLRREPDYWRERVNND